MHSLPDFLVFAAIPCRLFGARLVLDLHESLPEIYRARFPGRDGSFASRLSVAAQRMSCAVATRVITVNSTIAFILESRGVPAARISVVENSPDWSTPVEESLRQPIQGGKYEITILGGLNPERDIPLVLQAARLLRDSFPIRWRIIGAGDSPYVGRLREESRARGLDGVLTIENEVPAESVPSLVAASTIGIVSYQRNPLTEIATPNKAYEYAVAGKAMVVADLRALRALLGDAALYYLPGDPEDLAAKIRNLLESAPERERLGRAARLRIDEHRWEIMAGRLIRAYRECLQGAAATASIDGSRGLTDVISGGLGDGR